MPSILLIHGVQSSHTTWWRLGADLADLGWQVRAVDLLGHGGRTSPAPWGVTELARDVVEQAATDHVDLVVGHSLGAVVALRLAALEPAFATGVMLEDPPSLDGAPTAASVADGIERAIGRASADPDAEQAAVLRDNPLWAVPDAANAVANRLSLDVAAVTAFLRGNRWDLPQLLAGCPVPVQLLVAESPATALTEPTRSELLAALPVERVRSLVCGHGMHRDRPALWLDTVTRFATALGVAPSGTD